MSATLLFAKTGDPIQSTKPVDKVLVANKTIKGENLLKPIQLKVEEEISPRDRCILNFAFFLWSHGGSFMEGVAIGSQLCSDLPTSLSIEQGE